MKINSSCLRSRRSSITRFFILLALVGGLCFPELSGDLRADEASNQTSPFAKSNLVAWCIVPFDAKQRSPAERAEMVQRLGLRRVAYDWRDEHVPTFEEEILQYKQHGIEYFAFWSWHDDLEALIQKHQIHPQIWITCPSPKADTQSARIAEAVAQLTPLVDKTRKLNLSLGLYNHGGWGGEPENLVAVCEQLRSQAEAEHVGIVYNFHHGHEHVADFAASLKLMLPYLLCLNINGMTDNQLVLEDAKHYKILPLGSGKYELGMLRAILESKYLGPIGILDHRDELDAEQSLSENLRGLKELLQQLGDQPALATF